MIPVEHSHLLVAADSHPGMSGKNNEDRYAVSAFRLSQENPAPILFAVLSDGIGGHQAGEVAAELAVNTISHAIANSDGSHPLPTLREAIIEASQLILEHSNAQDQNKGMGATCVCCWIIQNQLYLAYAGDSRAYLIRGNTIQQISHDHTWIQEALAAGILTPEQVRGHPNSHVIRRYLGSKQPVEPDTRLRLRATETDGQSLANQGTYLQPNDQIVLCSDGLTDLVPDAEILATFMQHKEQKAAIAALIDLANQRGGHDNITIVSIKVPAIASQTNPLPAKPRLRPAKTGLRWIFLGITLFAFLVGLAVLAGLYFFWWQPQASATATVTPSPIIETSTALPTLTETLAPISTLAPTELTPSYLPKTSTTGPQDTLTPWPTNTP